MSRKDDPQLFLWAGQQRKAFQNGKLPPQRESLLREIGFVFDPQEASWWNNYELLCQYKEKHGDTRVPQHYSENRALGKWVAKQREQFKLLKKSRQ